MPAGREYHSPKPYAIPTLEEHAIVRMRAPPDPGEAFEGEEDDSEEEERGQLPGAFPVKGGEAYY